MLFGIHLPQSVYIGIGGDLELERNQQSSYRGRKAEEGNHAKLQKLSVWPLWKGDCKERQILLIPRKHLYGHTMLRRLLV